MGSFPGDENGKRWSRTQRADGGLFGERLRRSVLEPRTCNVFLSVSDEEAWGIVSTSYLQNTT